MLDKVTIKEILEKEKNDLMDQLKEIGRLNPETGDWEAFPEEINAPESDQNDMADRFEDFESRSSTVNVLEERLQTIEKALKGIKKESFGKCKVCGKEIEADRLKANPAAETCK
jgi:RNA polymerase-binding transcription factor DksA